MNENGILPIGTVVMLKGAQKRLMITGYAQQEKKENESEQEKAKIWDYVGCLYPEGYISSDQIFLFDMEQIDKIYYKGFEDDEEKEFVGKVNNIIMTLKRGAMNNSQIPNQQSNANNNINNNNIETNINNNVNNNGNNNNNDIFNLDN